MDGFRDNEVAGRYELDAPEGPTIADYRDLDGVRLITHVESPAEGRGQRRAARLLDAVVVDARRRGLKLRPSCSYAVAYFDRNADVADVLA